MLLAEKEGETLEGLQLQKHLMGTGKSLLDFLL